MRISLGVAVLALAAAVPTSAQTRADSLASWKEADDRFALFAGCKPVALSVFVQVADNAGTSLTVERATRTVRSRLRAARIYSDSASASLRVYTHVFGPAFSAEGRGPTEPDCEVFAAEPDAGGPADGRLEGDGGHARPDARGARRALGGGGDA